ncbi:ATP-binding protein [Candidatus Saccharibacteria bacterium]|nr:ATP-binding protein [Candidatus Saccharibacteria bacterium]
MKGLKRAIIKLTLLYTVILLALSTSFSTVTYINMAQGLGRRTQVPTGVVYWADYSTRIEEFIRDRDALVRRDALERLVILNLGVAALGAVACYFLALWTLKPIEETYKKQRRFIAGASHELRTPLTAMRVENEVTLSDPKVSREDLRQQVESNLEEIEKLQRLTNALLEMDSKKTLDRDQVVEQITNIFIDNAVKYDPEQRQPKIVKTKSRIDVIDRGPGITEEEMPLIFDRFYRGRGERSRATEGYGLGLSIARELAEEIDASIVAKNNPKGEGGCTFSLVFS